MIILLFFILAIGVSFTGLKAFLLVVWHFLTFVPLLMVIVLSESVSCIAMATSAKGPRVAAFTAAIRFVAASELGRSEER